MVEIEKPRIECVENPGDASYGKYVVEPLERGYGITLGNALRRVLLSSLPGVAVTARVAESTCVRSVIWLGVSEMYSGDAAMFAVMFSAPSA